MYSALYRTARLLWPGGSDTRRYLAQLEQSQKLSSEALKSFQLAKLQSLVTHAYTNVPFYHDLYKSCGITPADIKTPADFQKLPIITKPQIRENLAQMIAQNVDKNTLETNHTGGSTGEPLHFYIDRSFWWDNAANEFRVRKWHGIHEGDKMAWLWGDSRDMPDWDWKRKLRAQLMNHRFLNAFTLTQPKMEQFAGLLKKWQPRLMMGYSTTLFLFARFLQQRNITGIHPAIIESTAEKLYPLQRQLIEQVFQCPVIDHYSSREMGTMAYQCPHGTLHALDDTRLIEVITANGPAATGEMGRVVVTSFTHTVMPFIRYANDDLAIYNGKPCACGRSLTTLQEIVGRTNDYLVTAEGQFVHSEFFAYLLRSKPQVFSYQVHQPNQTQLDIKIVCHQPVDENWLKDIRQTIQSRFGPTVNLSLEIVDTLKLTPSGKHRYIISDIKPNFS